MRIVDPRFKVVDFSENALEKIERAARICYQSEPAGNQEAFIKRLIQSGHLTPLEHASATVEIVCDRGVSHELVRHRIASFNQSSTRYCNYSQSKFGNEITVIRPFFWNEYSEIYREWEFAMLNAEARYMRLLELGATPEKARTVLPNSLKTDIVVTANLREWMHIFKLRCSKKAHPQIRQIMCLILLDFAERLPVVFGETCDNVWKED